MLMLAPDSIMSMDNASHSTPRECPSEKIKPGNSTSPITAACQMDETTRAGTKKRPRNDSGSEDGGNGGSGSDPNKRPILTSTPALSLKGPILRLACPYFKFDPQRYCSGLCAGPKGWPDMNRLKYNSTALHFYMLL
jgi:hypothetical protein